MRSSCGGVMVPPGRGCCGGAARGRSRRTARSRGAGGVAGPADLHHAEAGLEVEPDGRGHALGRRAGRRPGHRGVELGAAVDLAEQVDAADPDPPADVGRDVVGQHHQHPPAGHAGRDGRRARPEVDLGQVQDQLATGQPVAGTDLGRGGGLEQALGDVALDRHGTGQGGHGDHRHGEQADRDQPPPRPHQVPTSRPTRGRSGTRPAPGRRWGRSRPGCRGPGPARSRSARPRR